MKHLLITLLVAVVSFGFAVPEAEAKRLGGGRFRLAAGNTAEAFG